MSSIYCQIRNGWVICDDLNRMVRERKEKRRKEERKKRRKEEKEKKYEDDA